MAIRVAHVNKTIGRQVILQDVSLEIADGEVVGLLGPNGAGKSTLMKILVGLWSPTSGTVSVPSKEDTGYLPEQNPLYDEMYIREYLEFMARLGNVSRMRVERVIEMTGLQPETGKKIGQLSKGFRQRVGLAQALLQDPKLLILDEPTTGLDPNQLDEIRGLIRQLGKDRTVILSTHILQEVTEMCTRVVILSHGQVRADIRDLNDVDLEERFRLETREQEQRL